MTERIKRNAVLFALSLIFLALFLITILLVNLDFFQKTDELINSHFSTSSNSFLVKFFLIFSSVFDPLIVIVICLILSTLLFFNKLKKEAYFLMISSLLGGAFIFIFKELIQRVRPENLYEFGFSFPSGHMVISIILFCNLIYFSFRNINKTFGYAISLFSLFLVILVGFSRLYLSVHWISDIIGGIFLGFFVFLLSVSFFEIKKLNKLLDM